MAAISGIEIETVEGQSRIVSVTLHDKVAALELLLRHFQVHEPESIGRMTDAVREFMETELGKGKREITH